MVGAAERVAPAGASSPKREPWLTSNLLRRQASRIEALRPMLERFVVNGGAPIEIGGEFSNPVEQLITAGGDSRVAVDPATGLSRYGTTPRPRPEAVHFSSSTASSISDYGFAVCDMLRRDLLRSRLQGETETGALRRRFVNAIADELALLLGLRDGEADFCVAASGTDTELIAVLMALAAGDRPLTNILISPEESGRGVALAGAGRYFDDLAATAAPIKKGAAVWPGRDIAVVAIPIRDPDGAPRRMQDIDEDVRSAVKAAGEQGRRPLLHMLYSSKTGLSGPSISVIEELQASSPTPIDVVFDACQMRVSFDQIGEWARRGWMVQISGSKFLTGPPFSGAIVLPTRYRACRDAVASLLREAPGASHPADWGGWWSEQLDPGPDSPAASCGPLFRWAPAIMEAHLFNRLPPALCRYAFDRFQSAIRSHLAKSANLALVDVPEASADGAPSPAPDLSGRSIVCFCVLADEWNGGKRRLGEPECQRIFQLLNLDLSERFGPLGPVEQVLAGQRAHIGQPVRLGAGSEPEGYTVLRLVLGARFFTIVGHAGPGAIEAALESEISDAVHALDKVALIAKYWWKIEDDA